MTAMTAGRAAVKSALGKTIAAVSVLSLLAAAAFIVCGGSDASAGECGGGGGFSIEDGVLKIRYPRLMISSILLQ